MVASADNGEEGRPAQSTECRDGEYVASRFRTLGGLVRSSPCPLPVITPCEFCPSVLTVTSGAVPPW